MPSKIFINARFMEQPETGVQVFAREIALELTQLDKNIKLISPAKKDKKFTKKIPVKYLSLLSGTLWEQIVLPFYLIINGSPLLINLGNTAPFLYKNQIVTLHDVAFKQNPDWFSSKFIRWYNFLIPRILKRSLHVLTVSNFSKNEIHKYFNTDIKKIDVIHNGLSEQKRSDQMMNKFSEKKFILCVGTFSDRKNQLAVLKAFQKIESPDCSLILTGSFDQLFGDQQELLNEIKRSEQIELIERPNDETLSQLYQSAMFSVYLSHYEGFGLPVLESISNNCPALVSDIPVFKELFNNHIHFTNQNDLFDVSQQMKYMLENYKDMKLVLQKDTLVKEKFSYIDSSKKVYQIIQQLK